MSVMMLSLHHTVFCALYGMMFIIQCFVQHAGVCVACSGMCIIWWYVHHMVVVLFASDSVLCIMQHDVHDTVL